MVERTGGFQSEQHSFVTLQRKEAILLSSFLSEQIQRTEKAVCDFKRLKLITNRRLAENCLRPRQSTAQ